MPAYYKAYLACSLIFRMDLRSSLFLIAPPASLIILADSFDSIILFLLMALVVYDSILVVFLLSEMIILILCRSFSPQLDLINRRISGLA